MRECFHCLVLVVLCRCWVSLAVRMLNAGPMADSNTEALDPVVQPMKGCLYPCRGFCQSSKIPSSDIVVYCEANIGSWVL